MPLRPKRGGTSAAGQDLGGREQSRFGFGDAGAAGGVPAAGGGDAAADAAGVVADAAGGGAAQAIQGQHRGHRVGGGGQPFGGDRDGRAGDVLRGGADGGGGQFGAAAAQGDGHGPADYAVGGAVVEPETQRQVLGQVGGRGEVAGGLAGQDVGVHGQPGGDCAAQPDQ